MLKPLCFSMPRRTIARTCPWLAAALLLCFLFGLFSSCASTGPSVSREEMKRYEEQFDSNFIDASQKWYPRIFRVGYQLITSPVPGHGNEEPKFNFLGIGVGELKPAIRRHFQMPEKLRGVYVVGTYPGSPAESLDLKPGDVITKLQGKKVKSIGSFYKRVKKSKEGTLPAEVWRNGEIIPMIFPVEKVFYKAQFFLAPTPDFDANAAITRINIGIGALRYAKNDDELAVVMGHELAHVTLKHSHKKLGTGLASSLFFTAAAEAINQFTLPGLGGLMVSPMEKATDAAITRRYEREADYFGLQHAFHSGYDVANGSKIFARLANDSPGFAILAYTFATHPKTSERFLRLEKIQEEFQSMYPNEFPRHPSPDWEVTIPVQVGESLAEAVENLMKSYPKENKHTNAAMASAERPLNLEAIVPTPSLEPQEELSNTDFDDLGPSDLPSDMIPASTEVLASAKADASAQDQ